MARPFFRTVLFAAALLVTAACGAAEEREPGANGESASGLEHDGISIDLPKGWQGRILALDYPSAILQAANFDLARRDEDPIKAMSRQHALVTILPCSLVGFEHAPRPGPDRLSLQDLTFLPKGHVRVPHRHAFAHGSFDFSGRCLRVEADFGAAPPEPGLTESVDAILASLSVAEK
jgi:hypothetical protein